MTLKRTKRRVKNTWWKGFPQITGIILSMVLLYAFFLCRPINTNADRYLTIASNKMGGILNGVLKIRQVYTKT